MGLRERRDLVALCRDAPAGGALFSVVHVSGSSYRRPGAHMVWLNDGRTAGTLSGGCLEATLLRRAAWTVRNGAMLEHFSTTFDDTAEIPYGLGCGGEIDILAESLATPEAAALLSAMEATLRGHARTVATVLPCTQPLGGPSREQAARIVLDAEGDVLFASEHLHPESVVTLRSTARAAQGSAELCSTVQDALGTILVEHLAPVQRLVIFGAGEDARPLARLGAEMGWAVIVADPRPQFAKPERFPAADRVVPAATAASVPVLPEDAVVLMTHSYEGDRRLLAELLPLSPRYLGLLGARHRSALLLREASELCGLSLREAVERTHAPIGLELGGDGPEAVALAITAEMQHELFATGSRPLSRNLTFSQTEDFLAAGPLPSGMRESCALFDDSHPSLSDPLPIESTR